ncbi:MAG TPA: hypothetical protein VGK88_06435, partial [bacterium]
PQIVAVGRDVFAAWSAGNPRRDIYFAKTTGGFADLPPGAGGWAGGTNNPGVPDWRCIRQAEGRGGKRNACPAVPSRTR